MVVVRPMFERQFLGAVPQADRLGVSTNNNIDQRPIIAWLAIFRALVVKQTELLYKAVLAMFIL